ncbi:23S rRNA (guanosine(2251)-2'-O)-methyltransferase RlmB [Acidobacteriota bacterium]
MEIISRINPLLEAVKFSSFRINKVLVQKETKKKKIEDISTLAKAKGIPVIFVPQKKLDGLDRNHQGVIAFVSPKGFVSLGSILDSAAVPFLILLDEVEDPQNLGAIIRTAEAAGADGLILPERRAAGLTSAVAKVSAGAIEHFRVAKVKNLARTLDDLKEKGIWLIGAEGEGDKYWHEFDYTLPIGLIFGSEGKGLRPLVKRKCDKILSIPHWGRIPSLNVAAAASIFIYEVVRQRMVHLK